MTRRTSKKASDELGVEGRKILHMKIWACLHIIGEPMTSHEIAEALRYQQRDTISPRMTEMGRQGMAIDIGERRCSFTPKTCLIWRPCNVNAVTVNEPQDIWFVGHVGIPGKTFWTKVEAEEEARKMNLPMLPLRTKNTKFFARLTRPDRLDLLRHSPESDFPLAGALKERLGVSSLNSPPVDRLRGLVPELDDYVLANRRSVLESEAAKMREKILQDFLANLGD